MPLLNSLFVRDFVAEPRVVLAGDEFAALALSRLDDAGVQGAPVVDERGLFVGTVAQTGVFDAAEAAPESAVGKVADPAAPTTTTADRLDSALESIVSARANWIAVLDENRRVVGILTTTAIVRGYRRGLRSQLKQLSAVAPGTVVVDKEIAPDSPIARVALRDAHFPPGTTVMSLHRGTTSIMPGGDTVVEPGDQLGILTNADDADRVRRLLEPETQPQTNAATANRPRPD
jgi:chloride channel protein, CIC family